MINEKRLVEEFVKLAAMESPSRREGEVARYLKTAMEHLGMAVVEDKAAEETGGNSGNILGRMSGTDAEAPSILLNAHMDTVAPGLDIRPVIRGGTIYSGGDTILGSDDKSGIAIIMEVVRALKENRLPHGPLELLFTVCEEAGLLGAKQFDISTLKSGFGYSLDSSQPGAVVFSAPASNHIRLTFYGKEAHAGLAPEEGVSAIRMAGRAVSAMPLGRIDRETTANIGIISGGTATNIVPGTVTVEGEARSHSMEKLKKQTEDMVRSARESVADEKNEEAGLDVDIALAFPIMKLKEKSRVVTLAERAAGKLDRKLPLIAAGGGSDANIFNDKGIEVAILGTGMKNVHTNNEEIKIDDMVKCASLLLEIIRENCRALNL